jgi:large subunit ribosomal protein L35
MPKLKTHSGAKKRVSLTATGKVKRPYACKRHGMRKRSTDMKRTARNGLMMHPSDAKLIIKRLPYGL